MSSLFGRRDALSYSAGNDARLSDSGSHWLGWAAFLGASWTWCIGMFLPYILVRDYGFWGWVIFAIPNVLGAAAMGWVIRTSQSSLEIAGVHRGACRLFSGVTIAFHLYFCVAVIAPLSRALLHKQHAMEGTVGGVMIASLLMYLYITRRPGAQRVLAWCALILSMVAMAYVGNEVRDIALYAPDDMPPISMKFNTELIWLAPVCVFGFLFCPYLDLTFHRARQFSGNPRASFGAGFGVFFFTMIIFTLIYSRVLNAPSVSRLLAIFIVVHLAIQTAFTIAAHAAEIQHDGRWIAVITAALTFAAWMAYWWLPDYDYIVGKLQAGEVIYRIFMGFYGLVFPAYVWLIMIPARGKQSPSLRNLAVFAAAVLLATPMFYLGFLAQKMIWLIPGLSLVLLARLLVRVDPSHAEHASIQQNSEPT